jgi:hypothetical protein
MVVLDRINSPEQVQFKKLLGDALTKSGVLITSIFAVLIRYVPQRTAKRIFAIAIGSEKWRPEGWC